MLPDFLRESDVWGPVVAAGIFTGMSLAALIVRYVFRFVIRRSQARRPTSLTVNVLKTLEGPIVLFIIVSGLFLGFLTLTELESPTFAFLSSWSDEARKAWLIIAVLEITYLVAHLAAALLSWYMRNVAFRTVSEMDDRLMRPLNRIAPAVVYVIGGLIALEAAGISISPMLAGLGIVGLAVALALQPTLSNFFAGTYVVTEGQLKEGDYIELESGPAGYIEDIGWRSTKLRSMFNNLVIIPNSRMAESIMWNYFGPSPSMYVLVNGGVSYDSDLNFVEDVVMDVCRDIARENAYAVKDIEPFFGFEKFEASNVTFWVFMQATDRLGSFVLTSEIIKGIHRRFKQEGIVINYPIRKVMFPETNGSVPGQGQNMPR